MTTGPISIRPTNLVIDITTLQENDTKENETKSCFEMDEEFRKLFYDDDNGDTDTDVLDSISDTNSSKLYPDKQTEEKFIDNDTTSYEQQQPNIDVTEKSK